MGDTAFSTRNILMLSLLVLFLIFRNIPIADAVQYPVAGSASPTYTITISNGKYNVANSFGTIVYTNASFDSAMYYAVASSPASGGLVYLPKGTYYSRDLEFSDAYNHYGKSTNRDNIIIYGDGNSTIIKKLYFESTLASDAIGGTRKVTVTNASGFAINDRCYIQNDDNNNGIFDRGESYEDVQIMSISGNTLTVNSGQTNSPYSLSNSYSVAKHAFLAVMNDGITLVHSNNWIIRHLQINGNAQNGYVHNHGHKPNNYWGFGILVGGFNDTVANLNVLNTVSDSIELNGVSNCTIENNYILEIAGKSCGANGGGSGILLFAHGSNCYNNVVRNNTIVGVVGTNSTGRLIEMDGYSDTQKVYNNRILNNTLDTSLLQAITLWHNTQNNTISGNIFKNIRTWVLDAGGSAAGTEFAGQTTASGNIMSSNIFEQSPNAEYEVHLQNYTDYNLIENNYFQYGHIFVDTLTIGNTFVNNTNYGSSNGPSPAMFTVTFQSNLPSNTQWSVTLNGVKQSSTNAITFNIPAGTYSWSASNPVPGTTGTQYITSTPSGKITVTSGTSQQIQYQTRYYLTIGIQPNSAGSTSPNAGWYNAGATVIISATAKKGYRFKGWTGTGTGSYTGTASRSSVTMNGPITETATFTK